MENNELITEIIKSVVEVLEENNEAVSDIHKDTVVFGVDSLLDSLGLVSLIVKLEEFVEQVWKTDIQLVDADTLLIVNNNPLETPSSIANLITNKLNAQ